MMHAVAHPNSMDYACQKWINWQSSSRPPFIITIIVVLMNLIVAIVSPHHQYLIPSLLSLPTGSAAVRRRSPTGSAAVGPIGSSISNRRAPIRCFPLLLGSTSVARVRCFPIPGFPLLPVASRAGKWSRSVASRFVASRCFPER